jgi:F-type H+-transporting ATPase subunit epsilon
MSRPGLPTSLHLRVITSKSLILDTEVADVSLPSLEGELGILPGHRPLVTAVGKGNLSYRMDKREGTFAVQGGIALVLPDRVTVFTELSQDENEQPAPG